MSKLSTELGKRVIEACEPAGGCTLTTLAQLRGGQRAVICDVRGDIEPACARRMVDLGFAPGAEVEMLRRAPMADPVMFRIGGCEIALRREQARCIHVATPA